MSYSAFSSKKVAPAGDSWQTVSSRTRVAPIALTRATSVAPAPTSSVYVVPSQRPAAPKPFDEEFPTLGRTTSARVAPVTEEKKSFSTLMKEHAARDAAAALSTQDEGDDGMERLSLRGILKPIPRDIDQNGMPNSFLVMQRIQERAPSVKPKRKPLDLLEPRDIIGIPSLGAYLRRSKANAEAEWRRQHRLFDTPPESEEDERYVPEPDPVFDTGSDDEEGHEEAYDADEFNRHRG